MYNPQLETFIRVADALLKVIPVEWNHSIPYGLLHSHTPSETVQRFLSAIQTVLQHE